MKVDVPVRTRRWILGDPSVQDGGRPIWIATVDFLTHACFVAVVALSFLARSQYHEVGPFTWGAQPLPPLPGLPDRLGWLSLLPILLGAGWLCVALFERPRRPWRWGSPGIMLPLFGLTALALIDVSLPQSRRIAPGVVVTFGVVWSVALFIVNRRPNLAVPLSLVCLFQGAVAVGQFVVQGDLGLSGLGETRLDPSVGGTSVVGSGDRHWLRAYGLTPHPNLLGGSLAIVLLLLLPETSRSRGWARVVLATAMAVGFLGLLVTFSRASWLAFAVGLLAQPRGAHARSRKLRSEGGADSPPADCGPPRRDFRFFLARGKVVPSGSTALRRIAPGLSRPMPAVLVLLAVAFAVFYSGLVASRFLDLGSPLEARSLSERWQTPRQAIQVIVAHPWMGAGLGNYMEAARKVDPEAIIVHNLPLLAGAELGLPGLALWLWLSLSPLALCYAGGVLRRAGRTHPGVGAVRTRIPALERIGPDVARRPGNGVDISHLRLGPWLAFLVLAQLDVALWPPLFLRAAVLLGLLIGYLQVTSAERRDARVLSAED